MEVECWAWMHDPIDILKSIIANWNFTNTLNTFSDIGRYIDWLYFGLPRCKGCVAVLVVVDRLSMTSLHCWNTYIQLRKLKFFLSCIAVLIVVFGSKYLYFVQVDGMDALAVKQACKFAKEFALKNGPIVSKFTSFLYLYFLNLCLDFRNDSFILCYITIDFSILIILSRFLKWTHTDTMATPCLILAAHTVHVMRFLV